MAAGDEPPRCCARPCGRRLGSAGDSRGVPSKTASGRSCWGEAPALPPPAGMPPGGDAGRGNFCRPARPPAWHSLRPAGSPAAGGQHFGSRPGTVPFLCKSGSPRRRPQPCSCPFPPCWPPSSFGDRSVRAGGGAVDRGPPRPPDLMLRLQPVRSPTGRVPGGTVGQSRTDQGLARGILPDGAGGPVRAVLRCDRGPRKGQGHRDAEGRGGPGRERGSDTVPLPKS